MNFDQQYMYNLKMIFLQKMNFNVFGLDVITADVVEFYKSNLDIAKKQYEELINSAKPRGLDKLS